MWIEPWISGRLTSLGGRRHPRRPAVFSRLIAIVLTIQKLHEVKRLRKRELSPCEMLGEMALSRRAGDLRATAALRRTITAASVMVRGRVGGRGALGCVA